MKKSYHSKIVPSDDAAMTSRMSARVGSCAVIACVIERLPAPML